MLIRVRSCLLAWCNSARIRRFKGWDGCSGYHYSDSAICGFSHTHLAGTGCGCLGDVLLMPTVGEVRLEAGSPGKGYTSRFSHADEKAMPGYYRVFLQDPQVIAELTATARCGFHKYTFPAADNAHIVLDLVHGVGNNPVEATLDVENDTTISGSRISNGWGGQAGHLFRDGVFQAVRVLRHRAGQTRLPADTREGKGRDMKAFVSFKTAAKEVVLVKVGISGTGIEGARKNLAAEIPGWDFDRVRAAAIRQWKDLLDIVQVETFDPHVRNTFYANLYLCCQAPVLYNDVDGTYRGMDHKNHSGAGFQNYTTFSLWDTYRAEHPLLTLLQPQRVDDMVQSMLAEYQEAGNHSTPIWPLWGNETWCMIGYHSVAVIVEAYLKGFRGFDAEAAYQAMRDTAMQDRNGLKSYRELGYVASTRGGEATSRTIEYTLDDWCLARMAEALGHKEDAQLFYQRSANYRNLFDRTVGFFRGRKADGSWRKPFNPIGLVGDEYTEADAWQYAFGVQQDVPGLISLYGGDEAFVQRLEAMFNADSIIQTGIPDISGRIGQFSQGDEQCHHVAYLYNYAGAPYKTQQRVRQVMATLYNDTPAGQCGNVDCGQMAAWYVFSALGFYPVNPASGIYMIGSPVVKKAVLTLDAKKYKGQQVHRHRREQQPEEYLYSVRLAQWQAAGSSLAHPRADYLRRHADPGDGTQAQPGMGPCPECPAPGHHARRLPLLRAAGSLRGQARSAGAAHQSGLRRRRAGARVCARPQHGGRLRPTIRRSKLIPARPTRHPRPSTRASATARTSLMSLRCPRTAATRCACILPRSLTANPVHASRTSPSTARSC